jgi:hypothetical protein
MFLGGDTMKKISILKEIKNLINSSYFKDEESLEIQALNNLLQCKNGLINPLIDGYNEHHIVIKEDNTYLELKYKNGKAKITVTNVGVDNKTNNIEADYFIRKLSDYDNTLSTYSYNTKENLVKYETCSRDKNGISNYKGIIEKDINESNHVMGITRHYDYTLLENHIKNYDIKSVPMSIVANVVRDSRLKFDPTYEEYVETLDGNIINLETKVNSDDHYLFRKGNISYNVDLDEKETKQLKK